MRPTILIFVATYLPGYKSGGPLQSISNLVEHLGDKFQFRVITSDRDLGGIDPYPGIKPGQWQTLGKAQVCYLSPEMQILRVFARLLRETPHDIVYFNSFLNSRFTTRPLLAQRLHLAQSRPTVIAPRGEFSEGALSLKSNKKRIFMLVARLIGLHSGLTWQASSEHEAADIQNLLGHLAHDIQVARNFPRRTSAVVPLGLRQKDAPLRVVYLSRIVPMKNLVFALEVLAKVKVPVIFSIYGPYEDATYWARCEAVIARMPSHIQVRAHGPVDTSQVMQILSGQDLFFLPTLGENYGHVIAEAFMAGLPVLVSDQTPWRRLAESGIGADLALHDHAPFARWIDSLSAMNKNEVTKLKKRVAKKAAQISDISATMRANVNLFESRLAHLT